MIELWLAIIGLTFLALAFVCWPVVKKISAIGVTKNVDREQENISMFEYRLAELQLELDQRLLTVQSFNELKFELEKNLLSDAVEVTPKNIHHARLKKSHIITVVLLSISVPLISFGFYAKYGHMEDLLWAQASASAAQLPAGQTPTPEQAIALLEGQLKRDPSNAQGWYMLAGVYMSTNQFSKGAKAFAQVLDTLPIESVQYPNVLGQYAQAMFFVEGKVSEKVREQVNKALAIDENEVVSLGLLGIEAFETEQYQVAINYWQKSLLNAEPNAAQALQSGIDKAQQKLREAGLVTAVTKPAVVKPSVTVDVDISEQIKQQVDPQTTVFVFARPIGGKMPLAAVKLTVSQLPKRIVLDDKLAMMPTAKISMQKKVEVSARISLSGQPRPSVGDYESAVLVLNVTQLADPQRLLINKVVE